MEYPPPFFFKRCYFKKLVISTGVIYNLCIFHKEYISLNLFGVITFKLI